MNTLRLIIFLAGLVLIGIIYFWETGKRRRAQRRKTIKRTVAAGEVPELSISPKLEVDEDISEAISDLNTFLGKSREQEEAAIDETPLTIDPLLVRNDKSEREGSPAGESLDLFSANSVTADSLTEEKSSQGESPAPERDSPNPEKIIALHITAPPVKTFSGREIHEAMEMLGLKYGEMDIFHHYGLGNMEGDDPLFSVVDMFEPGSFNLDEMETHQTRGLSLFMSLPTPVDGEVVFELMLNTAYRLADMVGGEVRGPDHDLINDEHLATIRGILNKAFS